MNGRYGKSRTRIPGQPFEVVFRPVQYKPIINDNPFQETIDLLSKPEAQKAIAAQLNQRLDEVPGMSPVTENDISEALRYMQVREIKPGGSIDVKDGKISYEELAEAARKTDEVTDKDVSFNAPPRTFVLDSAPQKGSKASFILQNIDDNVY